MRYSLMAGGKRLRPLLVLAGAEGVAQATGTSEAAARDAAMPAACAIEMIHTYSLIHDDLPSMDDDDLRRGRPTLARRARRGHGDSRRRRAADARPSACSRASPRDCIPSLMARKLRVLALVAEAAGPAGMVGGQAIDLAAVDPGPDATRIPLDAEAVKAMHARKTGALIRASVAAGAVMGGADDRLVATLDAYGTEIGLAFQIVDDILDVEGAAATLGKTAGKDRGRRQTDLSRVLRPRRVTAAGGRRVTRARTRHSNSAGLLDSRLADIAGWIVKRTS